MADVYKRNFKNKNGEITPSKTYYFKALVDGKRTDVNTKCSNRKDARVFMSDFFSGEKKYIKRIQPVKSGETIKDVLLREGWFHAGKNPKMMKKHTENSNYGMAHAKNIAQTLRHIFQDIENPEMFADFVRKNVPLKSSSVSSYLAFISTPFKELTVNDAIHFANFLREYTEWEKNVGRKKTDEYFICQNKANIIALKTFYSYSAENGIIPLNIFTGIKIPINRNFKSKPTFSLEQLRNLFDDRLAMKVDEKFASSDVYKALKFLSLSGMRSSEIRAFRWKQLSHDSHILRIDSAFKINTTKKNVIGLPKWDKVRTIVLCDSAARCLGKRGRDDDYVFQLSSGGAIGSNKFIDEFVLYVDKIERAYKVIKQESFTNGIHFTPHSFRGTLNSLLLNNTTLNESAIQEYFGWTKSSLTPVQRKHYTTSSISSLYQVANEIELLFSNKPMEWKYQQTEDREKPSSIQDILEADLDKEFDKNPSSYLLPSLDEKRGGLGTYDNVKSEVVIKK